MQEKLHLMVIQQEIQAPETYRAAAVMFPAAAEIQGQLEDHMVEAVITAGSTRCK